MHLRLRRRLNAERAERRMSRRLARMVSVLALLVSIGGFVALVNAGPAAAASLKPTITKDVDANNDGVFNDSETVTKTASYPWTVTYRLTIFGGTAPGPLGAFHLIVSITDNTTNDIGDCQLLVGTIINNNQTVSCTYTEVLSQAGTSPFVNTATLTYDNGGGDVISDTATVNFPAGTLDGARTMGFWQNKNGQGIISGQATTGVCPSATWLRQYAPLQDLSATATCANVATYVYNVIKAADCGGSTCNAMLKAQMLATALDVYFSDPALGGNKLNAPSPIGGVTIDLTAICTDIPTCSNHVDVSSAFGGATSLTVSQMLAYAASQSNVGGSTWYGNVKAAQVLAKDAFDAINNQVAFSP
jgi:hypothetical protein